MRNNTLKNNIRIKNQDGFALITALLFFIVGGTIILSGITHAVMSEVTTVRNESASKQSYFTSESALEDAVYRIKTGKFISSTGSLTFASTTATVSVTTNADSTKTVNSIGLFNLVTRVTEATLDTTFNLALPFAIQSDTTGIDLNSCVVSGDVYSAGSIHGTNNCVVSGMVTATGKSVTRIDQDNEGSLSDPSNEMTFGDTYATQDFAQSFTVSGDFSLSDLSVFMKKVGNPSSLSVKITTDNGGAPSGTIVATGGISSSNVTNEYYWRTASFAANPVLSSGTTYWIVLDGNPNASNYYIVATNVNSFSGKSLVGRYDVPWMEYSPSGQNIYFKTSVKTNEDGISGVSPTNRLSVGGAYAYNVQYVSTGGSLFCQKGTANSKVCDTSRNDPAIQKLPLTDSMVSSWKNIAESGGSYTNGYNVGLTGATLGPTKIEGDLTVGDGGTLLVSGLIWVTGNVTINGGAVVSPLESNRSYAIIADGAISISDDARVEGSSDSDIVFIATGSGDPIITVDGGTHDAVLIAIHGGVSLSNSSLVKGIVGKHVILGGGSQVVYNSHLSNLNITSGSPNTGFSIKSWKETQ